MRQRKTGVVVTGSGEFRGDLCPREPPQLEPIVHASPLPLFLDEWISCLLCLGPALSTPQHGTLTSMPTAGSKAETVQFSHREGHWVWAGKACCELPRMPSGTRTWATGGLRLFPTGLRRGERSCS